MHHYRNTGAHFQRQDGSWVGRDQLFTPTEAELRAMSYKIKAEPNPFPAPVEAVTAVQEVPAVEVAEPEQEQERWTMTMDPRLYLKLHPEGQHAALARRVCAEKASEQAGD